MCGIAGYYSNNQMISAGELINMTRAMSHRGPDAEGYFNDGPVGLGHRRLSIIDLSDNANQPMHSHSGQYVIAYNGEVYNYKSIAKSLNLFFKTTSDTEVILENFAKKGVEFASDLNGMFAIAIYDKTNKELFLFRDRMGIKPLFYYWDGSLFAFASELKSLMQLPYIDKRKKVNINTLNQYLHLGYIPEPNTFFQNIYKFPSGSYAKIKDNKLEINYYWKLKNAITETTVHDFKTAKQKLDDLLNDSVKMRLISDVPVGTLLSGGIDSSLVTALAQKHTNHNIKTFSIGFKDAKYNEAGYAAEVAKYLGTDHHEYILSEKEAMNHIDDIINQYDEPYADSSAIPTMLVSSIARKQVTVTLSGDGGDELFHGYGAYNWAKRLDNPLIKLGNYPLSFFLSLSNNRNKRAAKVLKYRYKDHIQSHIFSQEQYYFSEKEIEKLLTNTACSGFQLPEKKIYKRNLTVAEAQAVFDLNYYLKDDLMVKVDRASMKYSLENRVPILDHRIVEFAVNLSPDLKINNGVQKYILKELLYEYVPRKYFNRPKWGFGIPLIKWLKTDLKYLVEELQNDSLLVKYDFVKREALNHLIRQYDNGRDFLYNRIWQLIILDKVYKHYKL